MRTERQRKQKWLSFFKWLLIILILLVIAVSLLVFWAQEPQNKTKRVTIQTVEKNAGFKDPNKFYTANLGKTYFAVGGKDKSGHAAYAIVSKNMKNIRIVKKSAGITPDAAVSKATSIVSGQDTHVGLSLKNNQPVWIVSVKHGQKMNYITLNYKDGKLLDKLTNV